MVEIPFERLYLAKDCKNNKDIYVDKCPLIQHQLDGIRFLYKALKKKIPAVILNDPSGYGKRVQTALFLSAVLPMLDKPVLILCREGTDQKWMRSFQQWTQVSDDVAIELSNPFIKKKIVISALYCASEFARREWAVLVVDDDVISRDILKSSLKADLRIWITSSSIKEDLTKFSTFCTWVYPKKDKDKYKFDANRFKVNKEDLKDVILKSAMLDAFLEDIVLRRDCGFTSFTKTQVSIPNIEPRTTKKNKDATGTKIKRSKRKSDIDNTAIENVQSKVARTNKLTDNIEQNTEVFEIGDFAAVKPIEVTNIGRKEIVTDVDNINTQSDDDNFIPSYNKSKKSKILWDSEDSNDEIKTTDIQTAKYEDQNDSDLNESDETKVLRWDSETDTEKDHKESQNGGPKFGTKSPTIDKRINVDEELENSATLLVDVNEIEVINKNDTENEINHKTNHVNESEDIFLTNPDEIVKEIIYETQDKDEPTSDSKENGANMTENKTNKTENANLSSFEVKMKELEELTLKKYKGSFLDSIF